MKILFDVSVGPSIGLGHWVRSLALAKALLESSRDLKVYWLIQKDLSSSLLPQLKASGIEPAFVENQTSHELLQKLKPDLCILDRLDLQRSDVEAMHKLSRTLSIGGSGEGLSFVETRIDGMIPRESFKPKFKGRHYFYGSDYIILRQEFSPARCISIRDEIKNVFICLGGDAEAWGVRLAKVLAQNDLSLKIDVLVGALSSEQPHFNSTVNINKNLESPYDLLRKSDLAITAGGITSSEALALGVPNIFVPITGNQLEASQKLQEKAVGICLGLWNGDEENIRSKFISAFDELKPKDVRTQMHLNAVKTIDGKGLERTVKICMKVIRNEL